MRHYLFGYGSLISRESRLRTGKTGTAMPVLVRGLQRAWNFAAPRMKMTAVGVVVQESASCNGILMQIEESELPSFDKREGVGTNHGYRRLEIQPTQVIGLAAEDLRTMTTWGYFVNRPTAPTSECPIVQSYVDVILSGCLELGEDFAVEFIRSTFGWDNVWHNDRAHPRYVRHTDTSGCQAKIDGLLGKWAASGFAGRKDTL